MIGRAEVISANMETSRTSYPFIGKTAAVGQHFPAMYLDVRGSLPSEEKYSSDSTPWNHHPAKRLLARSGRVTG